MTDLLESRVSAISQTIAQLFESRDSVVICRQLRHETTRGI